MGSRRRSTFRWSNSGVSIVRHIQSPNNFTLLGPKETHEHRSNLIWLKSGMVDLISSAKRFRENAATL